MISVSNEFETPKTDLESAAWLYEQLLLEAGRSADRAKIRRALDEAATQWSGDAPERWWQRIVEASRSLGMKCKIIDCTFDQLKEVIREGAKVMMRVGEDCQWRAVLKSRGSRFQVVQPLQDKDRIWVGSRQLKKLVETPHESVIRCVVFEPHLRSTIEQADGKRTPFDRLWGLIRPETGDIWIITIFALVTGLLTLATPLAVETLVNTVAFGRVLQPVIVLALMLLAFLTFSAVLKGLQTFVVEIIQRRLFARVTADLAFRLPRVQVSALDGISGRELVNRFFDVVTVQKVSAQLLLDGVSLVLGTLIGMAVLAFYHPWLLGFDVVLLGLIAFVILVLGRGAVNSSIKESKTKYKMAAWLENLISCPTTFRDRGAAEFALDRADLLTYEYLMARKKHFRVLMRQIIFALGLQAIASTVLLGMGGWLVMSGQLTLGQLVAAELIVTVIVGSFAKLGKHMESYYDLLAAVDKLGAIFDLPMERQDGLIDFPASKPARIEVNNVNYEISGRDVVEDLNLEIESGARLILTGDSGSGKSHLLDMIYGIRDPSEGHITINGFDPQDLRPDALRKNVALVREIEIFDGTIAENVHLERPHVTVNDVREALEQVGLIDDVLKLSDGLNAHIVETGYPLSRNQQRKLMIARAIVGKPTLLLVDAVLDGLPDHDAERLMQLLVDPRQPWTLIMVTGRKTLAQLGSRFVTMSNNNLSEAEASKNA